MKFTKELFLFSVVLFFILSSCKKDKLLTNSGAKLGFSTDSILFDTVFAQVGSTTKTFRIYNNESQPMNISKVSLGGGTNSQFRINVDGISGTSLSDIDILAGDSLYVFVQVTVNPTSALSPLLIKDSIIFETNGNLQYVNLTAIGRNVYLHKPDHFPTNFPAYSIIHCDGTKDGAWKNDKPHLIFGYAVVDSACTLTMMPGTQVYLHKYAVLWVYKGGSLQVRGAHGNEVTFEGDRLEPEYKEIPGQWGKIWLMKGSINNSIEWAKIKNGAIGLQVEEPDASGTQPFLHLTNTIIKNMSAAALYTQNAHIRCNNCVFANCGQYVAVITRGGSYSFQHCTFADYWNSNPNNASGSNTSSPRSTPTLAMNNYYIDNSGVEYVYSMDTATFDNCIISGELDDEIAVDSAAGIAGYNFHYLFNHSIVKTATYFTNNGIHYNTAYRNLDPGFKDVSANDYNLNATSASYQKGDPTIVVPFDLNYILRGSPPDLGAYQRNP